MIEEQLRAQKDAENQRLERERQERARRKHEEDIEEMRKKHAKERINAIKSSSIASRVFSMYEEEVSSSGQKTNTWVLIVIATGH